MLLARRRTYAGEEEKDREDDDPVIVLPDEEAAVDLVYHKASFSAVSMLGGYYLQRGRRLSRSRSRKGWGTSVHPSCPNCGGMPLGHPTWHTPLSSGIRLSLNSSPFELQRSLKNSQGRPSNLQL